MPSTTAHPEAPYLCRSLHSVFIPAGRAPAVRDLLLSRGVGLLADEHPPSPTRVFALASDADLERAADILRAYEGWPY